MAAPGYQDFATLLREAQGVHQRGPLTDNKAIALLRQLETNICFGGGTSFGEPLAYPLRVEKMVKSTRIAPLSVSDEGLLLYDLPADHLETRSVSVLVPVKQEDDTYLVPRFGEANFLPCFPLGIQDDTTNSSISYPSFYYFIEGDQMKIPVLEDPVPLESAPVIRLAYWASFDSLATSSNSISLNYPALYLNGFVSLVFGNVRVNDEARRYWQQYSSLIATLNESQSNMSAIGSGDLTVAAPGTPI